MTTGLFYTFMPNPQKENGFTPIANEIMEALAKAMPGFTEGQIVWAVLRKTYGWNKKEDKISLSQLVKLTGKSKRMIIYALQNLEAKRMIKVSRGNNEINNISFQKNYNLWLVQEKSKQYQKALKQRRLHYGKIVQEKPSSARIGKEVVQELGKDSRFLAHTKDTIQKTLIQKTVEAKASVVFCDYFYSKYKEHTSNKYKPNFGKDRKQANDMLKTFEIAELMPRVNSYFEDEYWFTKDSSYSMNNFYNHINEIGVKANAKSGIQRWLDSQGANNT